MKLQNCIVNPNFNAKSILVNDPWDYVELWLKRSECSNDSLFYWQQARQFYEATKKSPLSSAPLTAYYCFSNATKPLLSVRRDEEIKNLKIKKDKV